MKKLRTLFLILTIGAFLLPFVPPGCADMTEGDKKPETTTSIVDTTINFDTASKVADTSHVNGDSSLTSKSDTLGTQKINFLQKLFLYPDNKNLSAFGYLYSYFVKEYFLTFLAFLFLWITLLKQLVNIQIFTFNNKWILLLGLSFLLILEAFRWDILKWGSLVIIGFYSLTVILFTIEYKNKSSA